MIARIDHVQVAAPAGGEDAARAFYGGLLGLPELPKPERLRARGGVWFAVGDQQLHVGIEEPFAPARKAHPALAVPRASDLSALAAELRGRRPRASRGTARASTSRTRSATASSCSRPTPICACGRCATTSAPGRARSSSESWGEVVIGGGREHRPAELPALVAEADGERAGLATYLIEDADCELVTLDALTVGGGIGGALVEALADTARAGGLHAPAPDHDQRQPPGPAPLPAPRLRARRGAPGRDRRDPAAQAADPGHRPRGDPDPRRARARAPALTPAANTL